MGWDEFADLVSGLNEQTPLVKVAQIRTATDPDVLRDFSPEQLKMRAEWQRKQALSKPEADTKAFLSELSKTFERLFND